jgi:hypothetical protein
MNENQAGKYSGGEEELKPQIGMYFSDKGMGINRS